MVGCAVFGCSNSQRTPNINLYLIPNDNRRSEYIRRLGRADKRDDRRWRICSAHFCDSAFERNALHEYVYVNGCKRLSTIALPTENLPPTVKIQSAAATPRSERFAKRRQTDEARRNTEEVNVAIALHESVNASPPKRVKLEQQCEELSERVESLQNQLDIANSENRKLRLKLQHAERSNSYYNRRVRRAILVQQCKSRTVSKLRCSLARVSSSLAKSFTRGQLQVLQHGKRYARWTDTEIAKAIVFRKISRRGYNFVRKRMNLPFRATSSIREIHEYIPLLTCRLSQDALESAFSKIRSLGMCYVQPSATEFDYRVRLLSVLHLSEAGVGRDFARPIVNLINYCKNNASVSDLKCSRPCEKCNKVQTSAASTPLVKFQWNPCAMLLVMSRIGLSPQIPN